LIINEKVKRKIIPITSGKGGVGKSLIAANLSIQLAMGGYKTIVIDLDLGGSNLHTFLGLKNINQGIGNFLSNKKLNFKDITIKTPHENLLFIPGDVLVSGTADIKLSQKKRIINNILNLKADYIIIDLGSGSNYNIVDFFLISNSGFIVVTNEATSILNTYGFLKGMIFRLFERIFSENREVSMFLKRITREVKPNSIPPIKEIIDRMDKIDHNAALKAKKYKSFIHPKVIINMAESPDDIHIVKKLKDLVSENLGINMECMGLLYFDATVQRSIRELEPLIKYDQDSIVVKEIERVALKIIQSKRFPKMPLDLNYYKDTFELAQIEAQNDLEQMEVLSKRLNNLDMGKILAVMSAQKKEIKNLSETIKMLTLGKD